MKKICSLAVCLLMIMCLMVPVAFAGVNAKNTLDGQVTLTDVNSFETYTIGYTVTSNSNSDWNLTLEEEACDNAAFSRVYTGTIKAGATLSAQINTAEDMGIGFFFVKIENGNTHDAETLAEFGNGNDVGGMVTGDFTVPDDVSQIGMLMMGLPRKNALNGVGFMLEIILTVDGKEESGLFGGGTTDSTEGSDLDWVMEDNSDDVDSLGDAFTELGKAYVKILIILGGLGVVGLTAIVFIIKGIVAKKAAATAVKAAAEAGKTVTAKPATNANAADAHTPKDSGGVDDSYVVTDPATGAQTLYVKDAEGNWVSSDGGSILNESGLDEWQKTREGDRAWQNRANEGVKKPTTFEEIDKQAALEEERIHRESYIEKVAIQHGADPSDLDAVYEKVSHDQGVAEVKAQEWSDRADRYDTAVKVAENLKTTADYSVSALGAVTGPAGTVVKDIYAAGTTIGGDVAEAVAEGKDAYDVAQTAAAAVVKSSVSVIQNHATGVVGKATADIVGGATSGGIDAYVGGESVAEGITKGAASGTFNAMVDTGGEMIGALKDGGNLAADTKDFISSVTDAGGDLIKNTGGDAIDKSFSKTFDELRPKKK